jgi:large subunit ribosomal protein L5
MRSLRVTKVVVNIGVGQAGERLEKAESVLKTLTKRAPVRTISRGTVRDWGTREGMPIGCKVTLRGEEAETFVKRALWPRNNRVAEWSFDKEGNLQFGIADHTSLEGQKYNPDIGVFGMDVSVVVERPGFRIKRRRLLTRKVPAKHRVDRQESIAFLKEKFKLEVV